MRVDGQAPRTGSLRTASDPGGSSAKQCLPGAAGRPGSSKRRQHRLRRSLDRRCATGHFSPIGSAPWYWGSPRATRSGSRCSRACSSSSRCCRPSSSRAGGRTSPGSRAASGSSSRRSRSSWRCSSPSTPSPRRTRSLTPRRPARHDHHGAGHHRVDAHGDRRPERPQGDPAAGKPLFTSQGCGGCHAFAPAGTNATVGPNLDETLQGEDAASISEAIVDPNAEVAQGYAEGIMPDDYDQRLSDEQLADLVAFLSTS